MGEVGVDTVVALVLAGERQTSIGMAVAAGANTRELPYSEPYELTNGEFSGTWNSLSNGGRPTFGGVRGE